MFVMNVIMTLKFKSFVLPFFCHGVVQERKNDVLKSQLGIPSGPKI